MIKRKTNQGTAPTARPRARTGRSLALWLGGVCFLAGSLAVGVTGMASATNAPQAVVANQGAAGSQAWPMSITGTPNVSSSQSGTWNVGQSGTWNVGITGTPNVSAAQSGPWNVGITGTPSVKSADATTVIASGSGEIPAFTDWTTVVGDFDVSAYKEVTIYLWYNGAGNPANDHCEVLYGGTQLYKLDSFTPDETNASVKTYDPAPPNIGLACQNGDPLSVNFAYDLVGRAN